MYDKGLEAAIERLEKYRFWSNSPYIVSYEQIVKTFNKYWLQDRRGVQEKETIEKIERKAVKAALKYVREEFDFLATATGRSWLESEDTVDYILGSYLLEVSSLPNIQKKSYEQEQRT